MQQQAAKLSTGEYNFNLTVTDATGNTVVDCGFTIVVTNPWHLSVDLEPSLIIYPGNTPIYTATVKLNSDSIPSADIQPPTIKYKWSTSGGSPSLSVPVTCSPSSTSAYTFTCTFSPPEVGSSQTYTITAAVTSANAIITGQSKNPNSDVCTLIGGSGSNKKYNCNYGTGSDTATLKVNPSGLYAAFLESIILRKPASCSIISSRLCIRVELA